jgi:osmoprotectant transport system permease protein
VGQVVTPLVLLAVLGALWLYVSNADLDSIERRSINPGYLWDRLLEHVELTAVCTVFVVVVAVSLGIVLTRSRARRLVPFVLTLANIGQAAPAIGIIVLLTFVLGIGFSTAVVALSVYSVLPVLRNTIVGIEQVDHALVDAGRGMGMTALGVLVKVELPLAVPVILAGIRTALVLNVGTATLAAFINAGGLGDLIVTGIKLDRQPVLLVGSVLTAVLALFVDWVAGVAEDVLTPKGVAAHS